MKSIESEYNIGIETFLTKDDGIGGKLRTIPEDFFVLENSFNPPIQENGKFTIADITDVNWETNLLVREFSKKLHISRKRISFAGTKDKRAKKIRKMSFFRVSKDELLNLKIKNVIIKNIYHSNIGIKLGDLEGNSFQINIRNIKEKTKDGYIKKILKM